MENRSTDLVIVQNIKYVTNIISTEYCKHTHTHNHQCMINKTTYQTGALQHTEGPVQMLSPLCSLTCQQEDLHEKL